MNCATPRARRLVAGLCLMLLAGCAAPGREDYTDLVASSAPAAPAGPQLGAHEFVAADGTRLPLRVWLPKGEVEAVILALHGFNDYSNAFEAPATALAFRGVATYAYDQRGFGEAPLRGRWVGRWQLADDLATASRLLRARYPGVPLYLLGESMGGAVVTVAMTGETGASRPQANGVILVAPAVWGRQTMNVFERAALWVAIHILPSTTVTVQRHHPGQGIRQHRHAARLVGRPAGHQGAARRCDLRPRRSHGCRACCRPEARRAAALSLR